MGLHIFVALSITALGFKLLGSEGPQLLVFLIGAFLFISPIYLNVKTNTFVKNISWMINSARSRTQLVTYYHLELIFRILLTLSPFIIYSYLLKSKDQNSSFDLDIFSENYLLMILGTWAAANFLGLSMGSIKKPNGARVSRKSSPKKTFIFFFLFFFAIYIGDIIIGSPVAMEGLLIVISFLFLVYVYSTHFVLFRIKTRNYIFLAGSIILIIPTFFSIGSLTTQVENSNESIDEYLELGSLVNYIHIENRNGILQSIGAKGKLNSFLTITEESSDLDLISKIDPKNGFEQNRNLIKSVNHKIKLEEFERLIQKVESLSRGDVDKLISKKVFGRIISKSKISQDSVIESLVNSDSKLKQHIALQMVYLFKGSKELVKFKENHSFMLSNDQLESIK
jgi:hypothetical protein